MALSCPFHLLLICAVIKKKKTPTPAPKLCGVHPRQSRTGFALWPRARGAPLSPAEPVTFAEVSGTRCVRVSVPAAAPPRSPAPLLVPLLEGGHDPGLLNHSARGVAGLRRVPSPCAAVGPRNVLVPVNTCIYNCGGGRLGLLVLLGCEFPGRSIGQ